MKRAAYIFQKKIIRVNSVIREISRSGAKKIPTLRGSGVNYRKRIILIFAVIALSREASFIVIRTIFSWSCFRYTDAATFNNAVV